MPLLDHFHPPLSRTHPWRSFHGAWAAATARLLNQGILPADYNAVPLVSFDGPVEIDVATLQEVQVPGPDGGTQALQPWTPPAPTLAVAIELPAVEDVEVQVFFDGNEPRLTAALELVIPRRQGEGSAGHGRRNKEFLFVPQSRHAPGRRRKRLPSGSPQGETKRSEKDPALDRVRSSPGP